MIHGRAGWLDLHAFYFHMLEQGRRKFRTVLSDVNARGTMLLQDFLSPPRREVNQGQKPNAKDNHDHVFLLPGLAIFVEVSESMTRLF